MIDTTELQNCLSSLGLERWHPVLQAFINQRLSPGGHGDFERWQNIVQSITAAPNDPPSIRALLLELAPWRKGPFSVGGIDIDAEWRSDLKWERLQKGIAPLQDRVVLDVGCGNGFYALQMRRAGARCVIGVDPTVLYVMQYLAIDHFINDENIFVIPARLEELPLPARQFDTTFSMGVLYHQRSPIDHLRQLRQTLRAGGQLVLETIYLPGEKSFAATPESRYARMRNVWMLPTVSELKTWLSRCGYTDIEIIDQSMTTVEEQRSTEWMTFESLADALDPNNPGLTVEGWPAPHRVVITATSA